MVIIREHPGRWADLRWVRGSLACVIVFTLAASGAAIYLRPDASPVTVDSAVARFRKAQTAAAPSEAQPGDATAGPAATEPGTSAAGGSTPPTVAAPNGPAAPASGPAPAQPTPATAAQPTNGVYVYDTTGYEETDALNGARHDYPAQTTVTVRSDGCGWIQRWQPLEQRWDELHLCRQTRGVELRQITTFHEFFRQTQQQDNSCPPGSIFLPQPAVAGASTSYKCGGSFGEIAFTTRVIGEEQVAVGTSPTTGVRVRYEARFSGSNRGSGTFEEWTDPSGLLLQRVWQMSVETDSPFGTVHYSEQYKITLTSPKPRT
jgi:hypothetical protein